MKLRKVILAAVAAIALAVSMAPAANAAVVVRGGYGPVYRGPRVGVGIGFGYGYAPGYYAPAPAYYAPAPAYYGYAPAPAYVAPAPAYPYWYFNGGYWGGVYYRPGYYFRPGAGERFLRPWRR